MTQTTQGGDAYVPLMIKAGQESPHKSQKSVDEKEEQA